MARPGLTLAILTCNRRAEVLSTLRHACSLTEPDHVIVVDNASSDGTSDAVRAAFPGVQLIVSPTNAGAAARNLAIASAPTDYVALSDDDTRWLPGSLRRAASVLDAHPAVAVVCARVVIGRTRRPDPISAVMAASPLASNQLPLPRLLGFLAGASVVRREPFLEAGGFCPRFFLGGEEELVAIDLEESGWRLVYLADAVVEHLPSDQRNQSRRRILVLRNALWTTWLRWPARAALARSALLLAEARAEGLLPTTLASAAAGLPWVLRNRRPVGRALADELLGLDQTPAPDAVAGNEQNAASR